MDANTFDYIYTFDDTKINKFQIPFTLLKNNILIHSGDSSYSLDIIPEKVTGNINYDDKKNESNVHERYRKDSYRQFI